MHNRRRKLIVLGAAIAAGPLLGEASRATDYTWSFGGTNSTWSTANNWIGGTVPPSDPANNVIFAANGGFAILDTDRTVGSINFTRNFSTALNTHALTLNAINFVGGTDWSMLTSGGAGESATITADQVWDIGTGATFSVGVVVNDGASSFGITKSGSGTLVYNGLGVSHTYDGPTTINAGTLQTTVSDKIPDTSVLIVDGSTAVFDMTDRNDTVGGVTLDNGGRILGKVPIGTLTLNTGSYDLRSGSIGVRLAGTAGLSKTTSGLVTISVAGSFSGATSITGGTLSVTDLANFNGSSGIGLVASNVASNLVLDGGYLKYTGLNTVSTNRLYTLGPNGGGFDASGSTGFSSTPSVTFSGNMTASASSGSQTFTLTGSGTFNNTLSGQLVNGSGTNKTNLAKEGAGKWVLANTNNTYSGTTTVSNGTLALSAAVTNNIASSPTVTVSSGANLDVTGLSGSGITLASSQTLAGGGTVWGAVTATNSNTTLAPGSSLGKLTFSGSGNITLDSDATLEMQLGGDGVGGAGTAGTDYDSILVSGSSKALIPGGAKLKFIWASGMVAGQAYTLVSATGGSTISLASVFKNLDGNDLNEGPTYTQGPMQFTIDYDQTSN